MKKEVNSIQMHSRTSLMQDLERAGINPKGTLWLHLSLKSIGAIGGGADSFLDALMDYMKDGLLVIPTHTWAHVNKDNPQFDIATSPSCIGVVPDLFRHREGVHRSLHPTHSVAAFGREAEAFVAEQARFNTPCHPESVYGKLMERETDVLLIGVDFARNTLIHCIEEIADIPKRLYDLPEHLSVKDWDGRVYETPQFRHIGQISENYTRMEAEIYSRGLMCDVKIGSAKAMHFQAKDLKTLTLELLAEKPERFDDLD